MAEVLKWQTYVWIFNCDVPLESVVLQEEETCDTMWASKDKIMAMICDGEFIGRDIFPYIDKLLEI